MRIAGLLMGLLFTAATFAQSIVTPVFVHKDGDASAAGYTGSDKDIVIDGGSQQNVGWITFQTQGIDFSKVGSAKLSLYVKSVTNPGMLQVRLLTTDITAPENNVRLTAIPVDVAVTASSAVATANVENILQIDLTTAVKAGSFFGVALTSNDGLSAAFDSKEGHLAPVILLTHSIESAAAKWYSGTSAPAASLGKDEDYYLNTSSGDVSVKSAGAWNVVINIVGPVGATGAQGTKGDKGDKGDQGIQGPAGTQGAAGANGTNGTQGPAGADGKSISWRGAWSLSSSYSTNDAVNYLGSSYLAIKASANKVPADSVAYWNLMANKGDQGIQGPAGATGATGSSGPQGPAGPSGYNGHSPATTSTTWLTIASSSNISITLADNRLAFGVGQRIRIASTAGPTNFMEGAITAYNSSTGAATIALDNSAGSGTGISAWTVTVAGTFPSGTAKGDMQYWDGTKWVRIPTGKPGQSFNLTGDSIPHWSDIPGIVADIDGNVYRTIVIGNQEWTVTNLRTTHYNDGTAIPNITDNTAWSILTSGAYCYYNNTTDAVAQQKYGALYNWYAVNTGKLAPAGWRVPDTTDWNNLENYLIANGYNYDGTTSGNKITKSMAAGFWASSSSAGAVGNNLSLNNKSGFSVLGGGYCSYTGTFLSQSLSCLFWSATGSDATNAYYRYLAYYGSYLTSSSGLKSSGLSVRLVRDLN